MTEMPENKNIWVFYDGNCRFCVNTLDRVQHLLAKRQIQHAALQTDWVRARLGLSEENLLAEMKLLDVDGNIHGGADALIALAKMFWWAWPLFLLAQFPGVKPLLRFGYKKFAAKRYCINGTCALPPPNKSRIPAYVWIPAVLLPLFALPFANVLPAWGFMWVLAFTMFAGCKGLTWYAAHIETGKTLPNALRYFLLWPGMDPKPFLTEPQINKPKNAEWILAFCKTFFGAVLLWTIARMFAPEHPILTGWIGMTGIIFILHFGIFHLIALVWKNAGVPVELLMNNPAIAASLSEFWGRRWNRGFNQLVHRFVFAPTFRRISVAGATMLVFAVSGIIHDLVISLPARGGYGLPTIYFLAQGIGILIEHSNFGRALGLNHGIHGWLFMAAFTTGPAYWLFHPPFINNVILPMLQAFGATGAPL